MRPAESFEYQLPERYRQLAEYQVAGSGIEPEAYRRQSEWEFDAVGPHLPRPRRVLDLGCGLGRSTVYLNACLRDPDVEYVLADTSASTDRTPIAGWNPGEDFYNDLEWTEEFVRLNGVGRFRTFDLRRDDWSSLGKVDLVMSFLAVGFHFPIEGVLDRLLQVATPDSTMVFGVRIGRYGPWSFRDRFHEVRLVRGRPGHPSAAKERFLVLRRPRATAPGPVAGSCWRGLDRWSCRARRAADAVHRRVRRLVPGS